MTFLPVTDHPVLPLLAAAVLDLLLKGLLLALLGTLLALACRGKSAALRHLVWGLTLSGLLLLPAYGWLLPRWQLAILPPQPATSASMELVEPAPAPPASPTTASGPSLSTPASPPTPLPAPGPSSPTASPASSDPRLSLPAPASSLLTQTDWPVIWGLGVLVALLRPAIGLLALHRLRRKTHPAGGTPLAGRMTALATELGLRRMPALRLDAEGAMPMTWGWLRPVILLPRDAGQWPEARLRLVLLHELAHMKRRDWLTQTLAALAVALHWPNPLAWLAVRRLRIEQERACDDLVLTSGGRASDYAEELMQMATTRRATTWAPAIAMARRSTVERRLLAVLDGARNRCAARGRWWVLGGAIIAGVTAPLAAVKLTEPPEDLPSAYEGAEVADASQQVRPTALSWGAVEERVISFDLRDRRSRLDLDSGEFVDVGGDHATGGSEAAGLFDVGEGTDLAVSPVESDTRARMGVNLVALPADAFDWQATPDEVLDRMMGKPAPPQLRLAPGDKSRTWFIRTDAGNVGVLSLTPQADDPSQVGVRWKLVRGPAPSTDAKLQFRAVAGDESQPTATLSGWKDGPESRELRVLQGVLLDGSVVASAAIEVGSETRPRISLQLTPWGAARFAGITGLYLDQKLAVVFEGKVLMAPVIRERIVGGKVQISGSFTEDEAREIVRVLNRGKPVPVGGTDVAGPAMFKVAPDGSADYRTIQAAIDAAPRGAVIRIRAGDYAEHLEITKPVSLSGEDWRLVTIRPSETTVLSREELQKQVAARMRLATSDAERREIEARLREELGRPVLTIRDASKVVLSGIKFTALAPGGQSLAPEIIAIRRSRTYLVQCAVLGGAHEAIRVVDGASFSLRYSLVAAVWGTGIQLGDRNLPPVFATITASDIRNCHYAGIRVSAGAHDVAIHSSRISGAAWHGIRYDETSPHVFGNYIFGNARCGIYASGQTGARVERNVFHRNEMGGMSCWFNNHDLITGNTFVANLREGLSVLGSSQPSIAGNVFASEKVGITQGRIGDKSPSATNLVALRLERNLFWDNATNLLAVSPDDPSLKPVRTPLPGDSHSVFADPQFVDPEGGDFSLAERSPARALSTLVRARSLDCASPFPLQPEELAIIPDTDTRDSRAWKKP